jgi:hypothetical protein
LVAKTGEVVNEEGTNLRHDEWEETSVLGLARNVTAIHEDIFTPTVTMEVTEDL